MRLPLEILPLLLCVAMLHVSSGLAQDSAEQPSDDQSREKTLPPARQNKLLRDFFRALYPRYQREPPVDEFVENFVDSQIDALLTEIQEKLNNLNQTCDMATKLRERWMNAPAQEKNPARIALVATLRRLADRSDDLADRLSSLFVGLKRDKKIDFVRSSKDNSDAFRREFEFLQLQVTEATRLVDDYFFRSTNTVTVTDLGGENMLVRLDWAEFMAKDLAKRIR
jgi:hypothetical protein